MFSAARRAAFLFGKGVAVSDQSSLFRDVLAAAAANATVISALAGAAGGLTSHLVITDGGEPRARLMRAVRQVAVGAMAASFGGVAVGGLIANSLGLGADTIAAFGGGASLAYFVGVFGPAVLEVALLRIKKASPGGGDA